MQKKTLDKALEALQNGEIIVYPTDTLYGIAADIYNKKAVNKVFNIKKRPHNNPLPVAVSSLEEINKIAYTDKRIKKIVKTFLPGELTILLNKKKSVPPIVNAGLNKVAIRIPDNNIALQLLSKYGSLTATSANFHDRKTPYTIEKIKKQFKNKIAVYIDDGILKSKPSTIVDLTTDQPVLIREGNITLNEILDEI